MEYALRRVDATIGVARYRLPAPDALPGDLAGVLPTQDELTLGMLPAEETDNE